MNLHFLKLRVASDPWILVDRCGVRPVDGLVTPGNPPRPEDYRSDESPTRPEARAVFEAADKSPDWPAAAALTCHPHRGASARGLVVIDGEAEPYRVQAWSAAGRLQNLPPVAALCAARWLFDTGRATGETVTMRAGSSTVEIIVLDSRNFGLALGNPLAKPSDSPVPDRFSVDVLGMLHWARLHDGMFPRTDRLGGDAKDLIQVACVARHELRLRARGIDALEAAGAAVAAASLASYADRDCTVLIGGSRIMVQWPEGGPMFLAAAPAYCLSGDIWLDEEPEYSSGLT